MVSNIGGVMQKLSKSQASKSYLDQKSGMKSKPISKKAQRQLEQSALIANERIRLNNSVYNQSNSHSHENYVLGEDLEDLEHSSSYFLSEEPTIKKETVLIKRKVKRRT